MINGPLNCYKNNKKMEMNLGGGLCLGDGFNSEVLGRTRPDLKREAENNLNRVC